MPARCFQKGERVRSRITIGSVGVGTIGTILDALPNAPHTYDVQFSDTTCPYLMDAHMLSKLPRRRARHAAHRRAYVWRHRASGRRWSYRSARPAIMPFLRVPAGAASYLL
jgi:hypothetical protein